MVRFECAGCSGVIFPDMFPFSYCLIDYWQSDYFLQFNKTIQYHLIIANYSLFDVFSTWQRFFSAKPVIMGWFFALSKGICSFLRRGNMPLGFYASPAVGGGSMFQLLHRCTVGAGNLCCCRKGRQRETEIRMDSSVDSSS